MRLLNWIKEKYAKRKEERDDHDPWWVTLMLDVGRPVVAVMILIMCAPGEHYLAVQAGWSDVLAWGMPGTLTAYAGIAAVVATKRPKAAPGRKTAVTGAVISIALAMAAQPIAHLYGKVGLHPEQIALTVAAGLIPAAVFGHLLHMGAAVSKRKAGHKAGQPAGQPKAPKPAAPAGQSTPAAGQPAGQSTGQPSVPKTANGSLRSIARGLLEKDNKLSNDDLMDALLDKRPGTAYNTRWRSIARARKDLGIPA